MRICTTCMTYTVYVVHGVRCAVYDIYCTSYTTIGWVCSNRSWFTTWYTVRRGKLYSVRGTVLGRATSSRSILVISICQPEVVCSFGLPSIRPSTHSSIHLSLSRTLKTTTSRYRYRPPYHSFGLFIGAVLLSAMSLILLHPRHPRHRLPPTLNLISAYIGTRI